MKHVLPAHAHVFAGLALMLVLGPTMELGAQPSSPVMLDPNLGVRTVVSGLVTPTTMAFLGSNEMLVLEKNTGKVQHVVDGAISNTALDLAVNSAGERGLLGIALDPQFSTNNRVYLYWTATAPPPVGDPFFPTTLRSSDASIFGPDTNNILAVPLLGNRVDRFIWDAATQTLRFDLNLIHLRVFQNDGAPIPAGQGDEAQPPRANHNGGVIAFGPDGKLYVIVGDVGRRGQLQNLPSGPTETGLGPTVPDDQFGGPEPDDAHLTGVILRLDTDGSVPDDNPFFAAGAALGGEVGANIQKIFAYGIRNSFGMAFDPRTGNLWISENGDDSFDELNLVRPGFNSGWVQIMGPLERLSQYKEIETSPAPLFGLQQLRWPPTRLADTPDEALRRLFVLPGSHHDAPTFSWKFAMSPAAIGFVSSRALGPQYFGDLFVGFAVAEPLGGPLFHFNLTGNRRRISVADAGLEDRVADNLHRGDMTESESLLIGRDFGIITDIRTGPNGNLFVVSLTRGEVLEIFRHR